MRHNRMAMAAVVALGAVSLSGCGDSNYEAEKKLWHANYALQKARQAEEKLSPAQLDALLIDFKEIILKYPAWERAVDVYFTVAMLYELKGETERAHRTYQKIIELYPAAADYCALALKRRAILYEQNNQWSEAESAYRDIRTKYPLTRAGLEVPTYLLGRAVIARQEENARTLFAEAVVFYQNIIDRHKEISPDAAIFALQLAADCYVGTSQLDAAVVFLQEQAKKYAATVIEAGAWFKLALLFRDYYKKPAEAERYFQTVVERFPNQPLAQVAARELEKLKKGL
ncbi:MAG: tetratricopeptide repeat protein [Candidatus Omnitrophica bacterium]|nr:tetratricopeptide repeat protein [Candidatus Omnitrophota bacterium]